MLQVQDLIKDVINVIEQENGQKIGTYIYPKAAPQSETERKLLYKNINKYDEDELSSHNHRKVTTIYCYPRFFNLLDIYLLNALSSDPNPKYLTSGCHP